MLSGVKKALGLLRPSHRPHIGMATIHEVPFSDDLIGIDRKPLAYAAASGRTMTPEFRAYAARHLPDYVERMVSDGDPPHPDDLSGWLDSQSAMVACRATVYPQAFGYSSLAVGWGAADNGVESRWPNPYSAENRDVDWN